MSDLNDFPFPKEQYRDLLQQFYSDVNGEDSFEPLKSWQGDNWSSRVLRSSGTVLEKAGFTTVDIADGIVNDGPGSIRLFETLAYPENPNVPGFIIMTNMNRTEAMGDMIVFYTDLIIQDGREHAKEKEMYSSALKHICVSHSRDFGAYNEFTQGQGLLGGNAAECGFLNFFMEEDIDFLEAVIHEVLSVYRKILHDIPGSPSTEKDKQVMYASRARFIEWFITQNIGYKIAKSNHISLETIEAYGFPPVVKY